MKKDNKVKKSFEFYTPYVDRGRSINEEAVDKTRSDIERHGRNVNNTY